MSASNARPTRVMNPFAHSASSARSTCRPARLARLAVQAQQRPSIDPDLALTFAWAAGFTDGEGCISISKQGRPGRPNPSYRLCLDYVQNHRESLVRLQGLGESLGCNSHLQLVRRQATHNRQIYQLRFDGRHAEGFLQALHPYLLRKQPEAEVAIEYMLMSSPSIHPGPNGHDAGVWELREWYRLKLQRMK